MAEAFDTSYFVPSLAETLISLIPKVDFPSNFREFRPITLCNTMYKIITKVLVNRRRPMLIASSPPSKLVSFLRGVLVTMPSSYRKLSITCKGLRKGKGMWPLKLIWRRLMTMLIGATWRSALLILGSPSSLLSLLCTVLLHLLYLLFGMPRGCLNFPLLEV